MEDEAKGEEGERLGQMPRSGLAPFSGPGEGATFPSVISYVRGDASTPTGCSGGKPEFVNSYVLYRSKAKMMN